jgi:hypothetical protein
MLCNNSSHVCRYAPHFGGYDAAVRIGLEYSRRSRLELDIDEPSIEALQTLMLLSQASFQLGKGKKTFMLLSTHCGMAALSSTNSNSRCCHEHGSCARSPPRTATRHQGHAC